MIRDTKYIMRTLVLLLLFQFISPSLFSVVTFGSVSEDERAFIAPSHSSLVVPILLKEQEERDQEDNFLRSLDLHPIVNLSNHSLAHTASQSLIYKGYNNQDKSSYRPPLYELHRNLLI